MPGTGLVYCASCLRFLIAMSDTRLVTVYGASSFRVLLVRALNIPGDVLRGLVPWPRPGRVKAAAIRPGPGQWQAEWQCGTTTSTTSTTATTTSSSG
eukprot:3941530-Rhodomonas_salina.1